MKKYWLSGLHILMISCLLHAQDITFEEYDLDNGLHVILHQDPTTPVVTTAVMYHVGSKDEDPQQTGFAHFFEHLSFEGTQNIKRGEWDKIVASYGGMGNANTFLDRTYYYETFPAHNWEVGLWLESERMLHPVIGQVGIDTQKKVVQEERSFRIDHEPYGAFFEQLLKNLYFKHPYRWGVMGNLQHLASANLADFKRFNAIYYVPNNAVLVVAGDIDIKKAKRKIAKYFESISRGAEIVRKKIVEKPITVNLKATYYDPNIQIPAILLAYRTPGHTERDAYILNMISIYLSDGESAKLYKTLVEEKKMALQVFSEPILAEAYTTYVIGGIPAEGNTMQELKDEIDAEILRMQTELITEKDYRKILNKLESYIVSDKSSIQDIAHTLAENYLLYGNTNLINTEIALYHTITREEIRAAAQKYLYPNQRVELEYLPTQHHAY